jgi:hypothetical protein
MATPPATKPAGQYPVLVDPGHSIVQQQRQNARMLRITCGPREKPVIHGNARRLHNSIHIAGWQDRRDHRQSRQIPNSEG